MKLFLFMMWIIAILAAISCTPVTQPSDAVDAPRQPRNSLGVRYLGDGIYLMETPHRCIFTIFGNGIAVVDHNPAIGCL